MTVFRGHLPALGAGLLIAITIVAVAGAIPVAPEAAGGATGAAQIATCPAAEAAAAEALLASEVIDGQDVVIAYPPVMLCDPALERAVRGLVKGYIDDTVSFADTLSAAERDELARLARDARARGFAWSHEISIGQLYGNARLVSLLAGIYAYTGGAHGNLYYSSLVFDFDAARSLALGDLFEPGSPYLAAIAAFVREDLYRQKRARGSFMSGDSAAGGDDFIEMGAAPERSNYEVFGLYGNRADAPHGLSFHFAPYQVGAFAEGEFSVDVPLVVFDAHLRPSARSLFENP